MLPNELLEVINEFRDSSTEGTKEWSDGYKAALLDIIVGALLRLDILIRKADEEIGEKK